MDIAHGVYGTAEVTTMMYQRISLAAIIVRQTNGIKYRLKGQLELTLSFVDQARGH